MTESFLSYNCLFDALIILVVRRLFLLVLQKNEYFEKFTCEYVVLIYLFFFFFPPISKLSMVVKWSEVQLFKIQVLRSVFVITLGIIWSIAVAVFTATRVALFVVGIIP